MRTLSIEQLGYAYTADEKEKAENQLRQRLARLSRKMIVIDDDPTGIQTVRDVAVYTLWDDESIRHAFNESGAMFFILTNSRSFSKERTERVHAQIGAGIAKAADGTGKGFLIFSRSDSTLRGHYPIETESLKRSVENSCSLKFHGEIIIPFFEEGGRYTIDDVHYAREGNELLPVGETEFAKDKSFGYRSSDLKEWCQEKTKGEYRTEEITSISLDCLHRMDYPQITAQLMKVHDFGKVVVNAVEYTDIKVFAAALLDAVENGKEFMIRTAASFLKVFSPDSRQKVDIKEALLAKRGENGGLLIIGSHVNRTTRQLEYLKKSGLGVKYFEFNQHRFLECNGLRKEAECISSKVSECMGKGLTAVVYTRRERLDLPDGGPDEQLKMSADISGALTSVVGMLETRPGFIIAKGGITSSDVMTKGLNIRRGWVAGQIRPGIPVLMAGDESRFPGLPYIIFPGNVGEDSTLTEIMSELSGVGREA